MGRIILSETHAGSYFEDRLITPIFLKNNFFISFDLFLFLFC